MRENIILDKSMAFAIRVVKLYQYLTNEKREFVLSKQLLRSGTSIGANVTEANDAISKNDFINKMYIALKECSETLYWLRLLKETDYLSDTQFKSLFFEGNELRQILISIIKSAKSSRDTR